MFAKYVPIFTIFLILLSCGICLKIEKCYMENKIIFQEFYGQKQKGSMFGYIDAELDFDRIKDVVFVKNISFNGNLDFDDELSTDIFVNFNSIKVIRVQRTIEYGREAYKDAVKIQCNLGFVENYDVRIAAPYVVDYQIIKHAEFCIESVICNFSPEDHRIGDDFVIESKKRLETRQTTSQETVNAVTDVLVNKLLNAVVEAGKSIIKIPEIDEGFFNTLNFKSSGGTVDLIKYIKRVEDFSFVYEGNRYIFGTTVNLTGGLVQLNDISISVSLANVAWGTIPLNGTGSQMQIKIAIDYNHLPCRISVDNLELIIADDQIDFTKLETFWIPVDSVLPGVAKHALVKFLLDKIRNLLKIFIEGVTCEDYRSLLFGNNFA